jgi:hypothetical protein
MGRPLQAAASYTLNEVHEIPLHQGSTDLKTCFRSSDLLDQLFVQDLTQHEVLTREALVVVVDPTEEASEGPHHTPVESVPSVVLALEREHTDPQLGDLVGQLMALLLDFGHAQYYERPAQNSNVNGVGQEMTKPLPVEAMTSLLEVIASGVCPSLQHAEQLAKIALGDKAALEAARMEICDHYLEQIKQGDTAAVQNLAELLQVAELPY